VTENNETTLATLTTNLVKTLTLIHTQSQQSDQTVEIVTEGIILKKEEEECGQQQLQEEGNEEEIEEEVVFSQGEKSIKSFNAELRIKANSNLKTLPLPRQAYKRIEKARAIKSLYLQPLSLVDNWGFNFIQI
jgi:hypothetical protein